MMSHRRYYTEFQMVSSRSNLDVGILASVSMQTFYSPRGTVVELGSGEALRNSTYIKYRPILPGFPRDLEPEGMMI